MRARDVAGFLLRLSAWYFGILILWSPLGTAYRELLLYAGNAILSHAVPGREVKCVEHHAWEVGGVTEHADIAVLLQLDPRTAAPEIRQYVLAKAVLTFSQPYTSLTLLLALFFASSISWIDRFRKCLAGLLTLHLLLLVVVWLDIVHAFWTYEHDAFAGPEWTRLALAFVHASISDWPAGVFIVPFLLWLLLASPWQAARDSARVGTPR